MVSMLRKEAFSGSIHDLAHLPTPSCLAECLTKPSAKADNLITAVQTGRLLDVDIHLFFYTPNGAQGLLVNLVQDIFAHKGEGSLLPEHSQGLSCTDSPRKTISGDVCGDSAAKEAKNSEYT